MARHLRSLFDLTRDEVEGLVKRAFNLKLLRRKGVFPDHLRNKKIALIFEKPSTRTRASFEVGIVELGGYPLYIDATTTQISRGEPIKDVARVMSRYVDGIVFRTFGQERIEEMCQFSSVPVVNALSDKFHPCQILADLLTIYENFGDLKRKVYYMGDGNNVANSWVAISSRAPVEVVICCPKGFEPDQDVVERALKEGGNVKITNNPLEFIEGAHVIYTDVWVSMGKEGGEEVKKIFEPYRVDERVMEKAKGAIFLHCLPAHRGEEVTEGVIEGERSKVFDQAENRLHTQKAIMIELLS